MLITNIEAQKKIKGRYSVFVDGRFAFGLSETGILEAKIKVGQEVSTQELNELKKLSDTDKLYGLTINLIARRPRSRKELSDYLNRKTDNKTEQEKILNKLSNHNLIDDKDFAQRWVESRRLLKSMSKRKLQLELRSKGISSDIIESVLSGSQEDETKALKDLVEKKRKTSRYQDDQKLMAYLARQGFNYDDIKNALNNKDEY